MFSYVSNDKNLRKQQYVIFVVFLEVASGTSTGTPTLEIK